MKGILTFLFTETHVPLPAEGIDVELFQGSVGNEKEMEEQQENLCAYSLSHCFKIRIHGDLDFISKDRLDRTNNNFIFLSIQNQNFQVGKGILRKFKKNIN